MNITVDAMLQTLPIMGQGMAGIFIVMAVIALTISLLGRVTK